MTDYEEGYGDAKAGKPEATAWWGGYKNADYRRGYAEFFAEKYRGKEKYFDMDDGGSSMDSKIGGSTLCGFSDFFGAAPPLKTLAKPATTPAGLTKPGAKPGPVKTKNAPLSKGKSPHKAVMVRAIDAGKGAVTAGKTAATKAKAYKPAAHAPLVKLAASMTPKGTVALGAAPVAGKKPLTPKQTAAVAKHANAIARNAKANKNLNLAASKATKAGNDALAFVKTATPFLKKKLETGVKAGPVMKKGAIGIGEITTLVDNFDLLGEDEVFALCEMLGVDASGLSPGMPGYDPSTDPDMGGVAPGTDPYGTDPNLPPLDLNAGGVDPSTGIVTDYTGAVLYDPAKDPAVIPVPVRGVTLSQSDAEVTWQNIPDDGIAYDGSKGFPRDSVASYNYLYGTGDGFLWGFDPPNWHAKRGKDFSDASGEEMGNLAMTSAKYGWGPLIGNPQGPLAGLQYAVVPQKWFFQSQNAPTWATTEADAKITQANQKIIAANQAAAQVKAAQMAKDEADYAEAQAKQQAQQTLAQTSQDAANALAQSAADTQANIASQALTAQQSQQDLAYQKMQDAQDAQYAQLDLAQQQAFIPISVQQAQADIAYQQQQDAMEAAAQQKLIEQADTYNEWARANPEAAYQAAQDPGDDGGGAFDDGGQSMSEETDFSDGQSVDFEQLDEQV